ncbi:hypothetical protein Tco_1380819, partial [Tanacetum coccineum]
IGAWSNYYSEDNDENLVDDNIVLCLIPLCIYVINLGVFSAAKILADAVRRRPVSTGSGGVITASGLVSTAGMAGVSTASGLVSTAGMAGVSTASGLVSTAGMAQEVEMNIPSPIATKDKGKAVMQESEPPKKIKKRVQIQMSIDEELAQKLHEEEQARFNAEQEAKFNEEQEQERLDYEAVKYNKKLG